MHQIRENLDILLRRTAPEEILHTIRSYTSSENFFSEEEEVYSFHRYESYAGLNLEELSRDELEIRYDAMMNADEGDNVTFIFKNIVIYANKVLEMRDGIPVCKMNHILGWNSISKRLGQDVFVTAWLAERAHSRVEQKTEMGTFVWPAVLKTDDYRLEQIFEKGLAENHFHLHGSTQSFAVSWACLMNHPESIGSHFRKSKKFEMNLNMRISKKENDFVLPWKVRIEYAALIRALLFSKNERFYTSEQVWDTFCGFDEATMAVEIKKITEQLRLLYGARFQQMDHSYKCLDYAISELCYDVDDNSHVRLLSGERYFLYKCFRMIFEGMYTIQEKLLFYLYLSIKTNFRGELIQNNKVYGFSNFSDYQSRKNTLFKDRREYWTETLRLSIVTAFRENHMKVLEARIMPNNSTVAIKRGIEQLDRMVKFSGKKGKPFHHYVIHFPKKKFTKKEIEDRKQKYFLRPRNYSCRKMIRIQSKAIVGYLQRYNGKKFRLAGIDACSLEIGCRPEVFATEFRYIRRYGMRVSGNSFEDYHNKAYKVKEIGITYHVGEDFLDIIDGLRAIDECIEFLEMRKGDRLGHAIALGIDPEDYYDLKRRNIYISKQDYLDNLVWVLFRSMELNVKIESDHRVFMQNEALKLVTEIYGEELFHNTNGNLLMLYYESWKLRGDYPEMYNSGHYEAASDKEFCRYDMQYAECCARELKTNDIRKNEFISELYYLYHYDNEVKTKGLKPISFTVKKWMIELVRNLQNEMIKEIAQRGISIECNLTSNYLISTFRKYDKHPILRFSNYGLEANSTSSQLRVTINTDDLGVFDTSLENEYALLFEAICRKRHEEGNYNDEVVYDYLEYIRQNGMLVSFKKAPGLT